MSTRVFGVDPGPAPGIVMLHIDGRRIQWAHAIQCTAGVSIEIIGSLLTNGRAAWPLTIIATERFVVGRGSQRSGKAGRVTRDLVGQLQLLASEHEDGYVERSASEVKPWATDVRLGHAGLLEPTKGMTHARDGGRHALFAAVKHGCLPDPLSKEFKR